MQAQQKTMYGDFQGRQTSWARGPQARKIRGGNASQFSPSSAGYSGGWSNGAGSSAWKLQQQSQFQQQPQLQQEQQQPQFQQVPQFQQQSAPVPCMSPSSAQTSTVLLHSMPNNLCNEACIEAILDQAGLEDQLVSCDVQQGSHGGEAVLHLSSWNAANQAVRHFQGCRWGSSLTAELGPAPGQVCNYPEMTSNTLSLELIASPAYREDEFISTPEVSPRMVPFPSPTPTCTSIKSSSTTSTAMPFDFKKLTPPGTPAPFSPALTIASTAVPPSPLSFCHRRPTWADLLSDDEDEENEHPKMVWLHGNDLQTNSGDENTPTDSTGSTAVGSSDDGF